MLLSLQLSECLEESSGQSHGIWSGCKSKNCKSCSWKGIRFTAASQEEAEDEIAMSVLWTLVNVAGTKGCAVQWAAPNTHCHSGSEGSPKLLPKTLGEVLAWGSDFLRRLQGYERASSLLSLCREKEKYKPQQQFFSCHRSFLFHFYKINTGECKVVPTKFKRSQMYRSRDFTPRTLKEIHEEIL